MKRSTKRTAAVLGTATIATLMWPGPASGSTTLGGYTALAQAQVVRVQIYEPTIPIPSTPQIDGGVGFTRTSTDTGPVSRALASYLWPGDVVGDGFGTLLKNDKANYPVQVNSRNPPTDTAPAKNTVQLTDGNGMTTSSNDDTSTATVTGLGVAGPNTDLLSGIGEGLSKLAGKNKPTPKTPQLPVPVSKTLAGLATVENMKSETTVDLGAKSITSTARAFTSGATLLGGLISLGSFDVTSRTVSDGKKAVNSGSAAIGSMKIAGIPLDLTDKGVGLAGTHAKLPAIPSAVTDLLEKIGIKIEYLDTKQDTQGAGGSFSARGLVITVDTAPLKTALNIGGLTQPLADLIRKIPKLGSQVGPLLGIGPKIVFEIGDVSTSATASPAYTGGTVPVPGGGTGNAGGGPGGDGTGGAGTTTGADTGSGGTGDVGSGTAPSNDKPGGSAPAAVQPTGFDLPALGAVPRLLILGGLAFAVALGWLLRTAGGVLLGAGGNCARGLTTGVPDLRKG